jgi:hypothetical protein
MGVETIDAEVTSLSSEISFKPDMSFKAMKKEVINYEKRLFYAQTFYGDITGDWKLDVSLCGQYDILYEHILGHKYYINQGIDEEIPFNDALKSWHDGVYTPITDVIYSYDLLVNFPAYTATDLYIYISRYWDELKREYGSYSLENAARDFARKNGQNGIKAFWEKLRH